MKISIGHLWGSFMNSNRFHQFIKTGPGADVFHSRPIQRIHHSRLRLYSTYKSKRNPDLLKKINTFCLFIGHTKSGNSMLGSLIDAHPNAILADEVDALHYLLAGFKRDQLFYILLRASQKEFHKGRITARRMDPYSWKVNGQWQGKFSTLKIIGDSTSGTTTRRLADTPGLLDHLFSSMHNLRVKFIHTVRNPFDPISIMMVRGKKSFNDAFHHYELGCIRLNKLYQQIGSEHILPVQYEEFITNPRENLNQLTNFLELDAQPEYKDACVNILRSSPDKARKLVEWQPQWIDQVNKRIDQENFLKGYSFND